MHGTANPLEPKKSLWTKVKEVVEHYYTGFKLFFVDVRVSGKLLKQVADGDVLTRRQRRHVTFFNNGIVLRILFFPSLAEFNASAIPLGGLASLHRRAPYVEYAV
jgi:hypothetical protein